jgi:hypothetical protein
MTLFIFSEHMKQHRICPKNDCPWGDASEEKEIRRHVWNNHRLWAEQTNYHPIGGTCPDCDKVYTRQDNLKRHRDEHHQGQKRKKKEKD